MILPLMDNFPEDEFEYELHVHTGFPLTSGTKSKIFFRLYGTEGETGVRKMDDGIRTTVCTLINLRKHSFVNMLI